MTTNRDRNLRNGTGGMRAAGGELAAAASKERTVTEGPSRGAPDSSVPSRSVAREGIVLSGRNAVRDSDPSQTGINQPAQGDTDQVEATEPAGAASRPDPGKAPDQTGPPDAVGEIETFLDLALKELATLRTRSEADAINRAVELIVRRESEGGRVHVTGVGKSEYVARYIASLLSSTGTPSYFLHATECVHGSAGQLCQSDVTIAISNSGYTPELISAVKVLSELNVKIIGISGDAQSTLASTCDVFLYAGVSNEGGLLNLAPRTSILAENYVLCALSVALEARKGLTREQYARWHPGGMLGKLARGD